MISAFRIFIRNFIFVFWGMDCLTRARLLVGLCLPYLQKLWFFSLILTVLCYFIEHIQLRIGRNKYIRNLTINNSLLGHLYQYITHDDIRCFLLFGSWGVGKSYHLEKFINKIKYYNIKPVYRVSCFGISTRESLLRELQNICEAEDKAPKKFIVELIHKIPIVGDLFYKLLRSNYELRNIKKGSVFVFDDFERIAACEKPSPKPYYKPNVFLGHSEKARFIDEIKKEFKNIGSALNNIQDQETTAIEYNILDKFNIVTGLINELIEYYHMRVIVVSNKDKIPTKYFQDTFEQKLTCIKYHLLPPDDIVDKLIKEQMSLYISLNLDKKSFMETFFANTTDDIKKVWGQTNIENMRILANIINSYIDAVEMYDLRYLEELGASLFYSIFISYYFYETGNFNILTQIKVGENMVAFWKKYSFVVDNHSKLCIESSTNSYQLRWCGCSVSCQWILGYYNYVDIQSIVKDFNSYDSKFESSWVKSGSGINPSKLDDWLIFLKKDYPSNINIALELQKKNKVDFNNYSNAFIRDVGLNQSREQDIFNILDTLGYVELLKKDFNLKSVIFEIIYHAYPDIDSSQLYGEILIDYNNWVKARSDSDIKNNNCS